MSTKNPPTFGRLNWRRNFSLIALACLAITLALAAVVVGIKGVSGAKGKSASASAQLAGDASAELRRLVDGRHIEVDLVLANWLVASEIPEFRDFTRAEYFAQVDALVEQVRQSMTKMETVALSRGESLTNAHTRCAIFCNAILKLGFAYAEEFRREKITSASLEKLYADPNNICFAGLLRTKRGSCVSMPLIYLVIGQRLGMPVHLVAVGKHYFIRWEEPGYRMNIEPTIVTKVAATPDDSVYLETEGLTREQLKGSDLRNLTSREVVGNLLFVRSAYWAMKGQTHASAQRRDLTWARELAPDDAGIAETYQKIIGATGGKVATEIQPQEKKENAI